MIPLEVRGLTLTRPWGQFIAADFKGEETRMWDTKFRGILLLTSAKSWDKNWKEAVAATRPDLLKNPLLNRIASMAFDEKQGHIIGVCRLMDSRPMTKDHEARALYPSCPGRFAFKLDDFRASGGGRPICGNLGLWKPDPQLLQSIGYPWDFPRTPAMQHTPR